MISRFRSGAIYGLIAVVWMTCTNTMASEALLEIRIVDPKPLVSGQIVTVELSLLSDKPIIGAAKFALPPLDFGVWLEQSRSSYNGFSLIGGRRVPTLITSYSVWIQKVGKFQVPPVHVSAPVLINGVREHLNAETASQPLSVQYPQVQGQPASQLVDFLVASTVQISSLLDLPAELKLGQVVEQTLTIRAEGALPVSFPELDVVHLDGLSIDKLPINSSVEYIRGTVVTTQTVTLRYTLLQSGAHNIPSYSLTWWNTGSQQFQTLRSQSYDLYVNAPETQDAMSVSQSALLLLAGACLIVLLAWILMSYWTRILVTLKTLKSPVLPERLNP